MHLKRLFIIAGWLSCCLTSFLGAEEASLQALSDDSAVPHMLSIPLNKTKIDFGGWVQLQRNVFLDSPMPAKQPMIRRLRLYATSDLTENIEWMFMVQGDRNYWNYHYAYVDLTSQKNFKLRAGLFKKPFGLEALYSSRYLWMVNRSLGTINYLNLLDIGLAAYGSLFNDRLEYKIGLFNGNQRNLKNNPQKQVTARFTFYLFASAARAWLKHFRLGMSFLSCQKVVNLSNSSFQTGSGTSFLRWENHVKSKTSKMIIGSDFEWLYKNFVLRGELLLVNWGKVMGESLSIPFTGYSWYVEGSYFVTGEKELHNSALTPSQNFNLCKGGGAFELAARYEAFQADRKSIQTGLSNGTSYVSGFTVAANYYFNRYILARVNWQKNYFHHTITVKNQKTRDESVLTFRLQAEF